MTITEDGGWRVGRPGLLEVAFERRFNCVEVITLSYPTIIEISKTFLITKLGIYLDIYCTVVRGTVEYSRRMCTWTWTPYIYEVP